MVSHLRFVLESDEPEGIRRELLLSDIEASSTLSREALMKRLHVLLPSGLEILSDMEQGKSSIPVRRRKPILLYQDAESLSVDASSLPKKYSIQNIGRSIKNLLCPASKINLRSSENVRMIVCFYVCRIPTRLTISLSNPTLSNTPFSPNVNTPV